MRTASGPAQFADRPFLGFHRFRHPTGIEDPQAGTPYLEAVWNPQVEIVKPALVDFESFAPIGGIAVPPGIFRHIEEKVRPCVEGDFNK